MNIRFECPKCQAPLTALAEMAGRKAKCRKCAAVVLVPDPLRDRWPPGMAPSRPSAQSRSSAPPAASTSRASRPDEAAKSAPPRAAPVVSSPPQTAQPPPAPLAKPAPGVPIVVGPSSTSQRPPQPVDDIQELLDFEPVAPRAPEPTARGTDVNPYRSPASQESDFIPSNSSRFQPNQIRFGQAFGTTWRIFKANLGMCVAGPLLSWVCLSIAFTVGRAILVFFGVLIVESGGTAALVIASLLIVAFPLALLFFALLGMMKFMLTISRGGRGELGELFAAGPLLLSGSAIFLLLAGGVFVGGMVLGVPTILFAPFIGSTSITLVIGAIALSVPGILFALFFGLAPITFVDKNTGVVESFRLSAQAMKPNIFPIFLIILAMIFGLGLLELLTCGIALLLTMPFRLLLYTVIYLLATGQEIGAPASDRSGG